MKRLPPRPHQVAEYFRRRRSAIGGLSEADLQFNERLWEAVCNGERLAEPAEDWTGE